MTDKILAFTKRLDLFLLLNEKLAKQGFTVMNVADSDGLFSSLNQHQADVVVIDSEVQRHLSDLLADMRAIFMGPIMVISQHANHEELLAYFKLQVDDYLVPPVDAAELALRLKQRLWAHRQRWPKAQTLVTDKPAEAPRPQTIKLVAHGLVVDLTHFRVLRAGNDLGLTPKEFKLFVYLINHPGQVLSRDQILDRIWGYDDDDFTFTRIVDMHISHLRDKIEVDPRHPALIKTVRGFGYVCELPEKLDYQT